MGTVLQVSWSIYWWLVSCRLQVSWFREGNRDSWAVTPSYTVNNVQAKNHGHRSTSAVSKVYLLKSGPWFTQLLSQLRSTTSTLRCPAVFVPSYARNTNHTWDCIIPCDQLLWDFLNLCGNDGRGLALEQTIPTSQERNSGNRCGMHTLITIPINMWQSNRCC